MARGEAVVALCGRSFSEVLRLSDLSREEKKVMEGYTEMTIGRDEGAVCGIQFLHVNSLIGPCMSSTVWWFG